MSKKGLLQVLVELSSDPEHMWEYVHNPDGYLQRRREDLEGELTDKEMQAIKSGDQKYIRRVLGKKWHCFCGIIDDGDDD